ncbi:hypothetical protein CTI12_AA143800 [Artemisia annua]|uniref:Ubiquitin-like modifier-activating enzyme ATG7 n=1 Tax=Artemisia annua TaxID=35608 RepID=A0A2U1PKJ4_ARTAN|nr:hypothetical protein CTI12_AA143800 [Artemisia annua]
MAGNENGPVLQFAPFQSSVDEGFWHGLSSLKLNKLKTDESPVSVTGFYAPCSNPQVSSHLTLLGESLPTDPSDDPLTETSRGNRNRCSAPGILYNTNTLEGFHALDKQGLLKSEAKKIWEDIRSGKAEEDSSVLSRFLVISFADLKKFNFYYWFAFPALTLDPPVTLVDLRPASKWFTPEEAESVSTCCNEWRMSSLTADVPFFLVSISSDSHATIRHLKDFEACQSEGHKIVFAFYDPCHLPNNPGWPLRNFLTFISARWNIKKVQFLCYRENHGFADLDLSLVGEALIQPSQAWQDQEHVPNAVGWELNKGKRVPRRINLSTTMDPTRMAISAADLNLKLMRWRALPSLDLNMLSSTKCLLLGAGTLGCQVARMLMAWGVRKITLVDSGKVAMSNPLRQSLYTLEDCLDGGDLKALAAVKSLKRIFPAVEAEGVVMAIPMPGHPVPSQEEQNVLDDCRRLHDLVDSHDAVFLLTDTRESRWLPTLLCANANKKGFLNGRGIKEKETSSNSSSVGVSASVVGSIPTNVESVLMQNIESQSDGKSGPCTSDTNVLKTGTQSGSTPVSFADMFKEDTSFSVAMQSQNFASPLVVEPNVMRNFPKHWSVKLIGIKLCDMMIITWHIRMQV